MLETAGLAPAASRGTGLVFVHATVAAPPGAVEAR
jgi:hypothetical protein